MITILRLSALALILAVLAPRLGSGVAAAPAPGDRTAVVELFTSQGCSSCPPADRLLAKLAHDPKYQGKVIPLSFHVDYWNRLGWPDRFSSKANTQREYAYAAAWHSESVYTPCFVRNGAEWHADPAELSVDAAPAGLLTVDYDGTALRAEFQPTKVARPAAGEADAVFEIHAALLGGGIVSKVTAGENRGETLSHEFVALALAEGPASTAISLPRRTVDGVGRYALAVWVTRSGELTPLQAVGGWLP